MSRNEWEAGTIVLPAKAWPKLKADVRAAYNAHQASRRKLAEEMRRRLVDAAKGKRGFDWNGGIGQVVEAMAHERPAADCDSLHDVAFVVLPHDRRKPGGEGGPKAAKASDYPDASGATKQLSLGEAGIGFDEATRSVTWSSGENNHAVERAMAHPVARALFQALRRVEWTRGTGGTIVGNDEYNEDSRQEGGGANYVTKRFGPLGEDPLLKRLAKAAKASGRTGAYRGAPRR